MDDDYRKRLNAFKGAVYQTVDVENRLALDAPQVVIRMAEVDPNLRKEDVVRTLVETGAARRMTVQQVFPNDHWTHLVVLYNRT